MLELDDTMMGIIGILAGVLILSGWVPQIAKGYKTKRLNDVSSYLMILIFVGATLWLIYGMALDDVYIMGGRTCRIVRVGIRSTTFYFGDTKTRVDIANEDVDT